MDDEPRFLAWFEALYARHTQTLSFSEVRRALGALSDLYVHKRHKLAGGQVFDGRGKRAAFAMYYAPLHFLLIAHIARQLGIQAAATVLDVGCGTGAGSLAWAEAVGGVRCLWGVDRNSWALGEAAWNWRLCGHSGHTKRGDVSAELGRRLGPNDGIIAAYVINELPQNVRQSLLESVLAAHARGTAVLIVEPIAKSVADFWPVWQQAFEAQGGRANLWHTQVRLPAELRLLDKATGLRHDLLKGRSLFLAGRRT